MCDCGKIVRLTQPKKSKLVPASAYAEGSAVHPFSAFDLLATLVAVVQPDGTVLFANSALEDALGTSRRMIEGAHLPASFTEPHLLTNALQGAGGNEFAALRYDAWLRRLNHEPIPVHVIVTQTEIGHDIVIEMLTEYTQVIIREADRLQTLVDRLLAPHRRPHLVGDVNIHEVCERVRSLILAEFPKGLRVVRDYDTSIPEFRGDREQLIQTVLNIAHNACQALAEQIACGNAVITFRSRVARQITFGKQRYRLALELHVTDNGPGVPDSIKERIFYPLVSGREGGSGLGLTLAQTFVQQHHGSIECESAPGRTDFQILIPLP